MLIEVLLPLPIPQLFFYSVTTDIKVGQIVLVDFKKRELTAVVIRVNSIANPNYEVKEVKKIFPLQLSPTELFFINWVAKYNLIPGGLTLKLLCIPLKLLPLQYYKYNDTNNIQTKKFSKTLKKFYTAFTKESVLSNYTLMSYCQKASLTKIIAQNLIISANSPSPTYYKETLFLTSEQNKVFLQMINKLDKYNVLVLDGVTGSGKTEIYLKGANTILQNNLTAQVLILVPEIALTNQLLERFKTYLSYKYTTWHSNLSPKERFLNWHKIVYGDVSIVIGARSALFLPFHNLKLIIVDEEHDTSYKQDDNKFTYNTRDMAIVKCKLFDIPIILSSATPSLETIYNIIKKKFIHFPLSTRFLNKNPPCVQVVNMRQEQCKTNYLSVLLRQKIAANLQNKLQTLLFINKRGFALITLCKECGYRISCINCSSWLIYHKQIDLLRCHLCGYCMALLNTCPSCKKVNSFTFFGPGIEKVGEEVKKLFPSSRIEILSSDTLTSMSKVQGLLSEIINNKVDIILGTQVLAKGHHFPSLTLVGIIDADSGLYGGDLRAREKTFQLLHQVVGRTGRTQQGEVIVQTFEPESFFIKSLQQHDRYTFYKQELKLRLASKMPPYYKMASLLFSGNDKLKIEQDIQAFMLSKPASNIVEIWGPAPATIFQLNKQYRYRLIIVTPYNFYLQTYIKKWFANFSKIKFLNIKIDIDPTNFF